MRSPTPYIFLLLLSMMTSPLFAKSSKVKVSTIPIGSPFLRHFAHDYHFDLRTLVKFEKRGFGRAETITLAFISTHTGTAMKEYGKRRMKMNVSLRELAEEAKMDYDDLYLKSRAIKVEIEAKGDKNLPPPIFPEKKKKKSHKKKANDKEEPKKTNANKPKNQENKTDPPAH